MSKAQKITVRMGVSLDDATPQGPEIEARTFDGILAFHRTIDKDGQPIRGLWTITQIQTGFAFPIHPKNERQARSMARKLAYIGGDAWKFQSPKEVLNWSRDLREALWAGCEEAAPELFGRGNTDVYNRRKLGI